MSEIGEALPGEGLPLVGEGGAYTPPAVATHFLIEEPIKEKKLSFEEASRCLNTLGKDESGVRYAYLMIAATEMRLTDISTILNFKHVLFLDLSDNYLNLEALQVLSGLPFLLYLKVERNRVESAGLDPMYYLQCLILNKNRISETGDINQPLLETLELQDNMIYTIQFDVERITNLKMLNLRGNQLIDFSGTFPSSLEKLYLNQNKITKIRVDFSQLKNLTVLNLRDNQIRKLNGFTDQLANLTYLNLRSNRISKLREFRKLQCLPKLDTLIILQNPVSGLEIIQAMGEGDDDVMGEEIFGEDQPISIDPTRVALLALLPNLKRINKDVVTFEEKEQAEAQRAKILEEIFDELSSEEDTEIPTTTDLTTEYTTETEEVGVYNTSVTDDEEKTTSVSEAEDAANAGPSGELSETPVESPTTDTAGDTTDDVGQPAGQTPLAGIKEDEEDELKDVPNQD